MLEGLAAIDWLMIACAFALGFGVIKFTIAARNERGAQPPQADTPPADGHGTRSEGARPPSDDV